MIPDCRCQKWVFYNSLYFQISDGHNGNWVLYVTDAYWKPDINETMEDKVQK